MITTIDTNVLIGLWSGTVEAADAIADQLSRSGAQGPLVIAPAVYAELIAAADRDIAFVDSFLAVAHVRVDWLLPEAVWRTAALAYRGYAERRRAQPPDSGPRRILADFLIGAHALHIGSTLLTLDMRTYRAAFPTLSVFAPQL
jgi:predicted nucleic acid-binding protein